MATLSQATGDQQRLMAQAVAQLSDHGQSMVEAATHLRKPRKVTIHHDPHGNIVGARTEVEEDQVEEVHDE